MAKNRKSKPSSKTTTPMVATAIAAPESAPEREVTAQPKPTHDQIARRAYELWLSRGATHGNHIENWLDAERELHAA